MGAGGKTDREVDAATLKTQGLPLYKRKGGGGTVLLGPNVIVATVHAGVARRFGNLAYFHAINNALIAVFNRWKPLAYQQRGISDIAVADRKIVGSSIFRRKSYLLYQASILVELELELMSLLLKQPPREPDYRRGRSHAEFVTCLRDLGIDLAADAMVADLRARLPELTAQALLKADRHATAD